MVGSGIISGFIRRTLVASIGTSTSLLGMRTGVTGINAKSAFEYLAIGPIENDFSKGHEYEKDSEYEEEQTA